MKKIFGDFQENWSNSREFIEIGFANSSLPLGKRWRNSGLSANFVADYITNCCCDEHPETHYTKPNLVCLNHHRQSKLKSAISFIANELLENALKYGDNSSNEAINLGLYFLEDRIILLTTNIIKSENVAYFQAYLEKITNINHEQLVELYIQQIESINNIEAHLSSRLGYLTMINDYQADLGWQFEEISENPLAIIVKTMVQLHLQTI
ncbi:MAG: DUF6272 family protein [Pseudanabaena sp. ELA607]